MNDLLSGLIWEHAAYHACTGSILDMPYHSDLAECANACSGCTDMQRAMLVVLGASLVERKHTNTSTKTGQTNYTWTQVSCGTNVVTGPGEVLHQLWAFRSSMSPTEQPGSTSTLALLAKCSVTWRSQQDRCG